LFYPHYNIFQPPPWHLAAGLSGDETAPSQLGAAAAAAFQVAPWTGSMEEMGWNQPILEEKKSWKNCEKLEEHMKM